MIFKVLGLSVLSLSAIIAVKSIVPNLAPLIAVISGIMILLYCVSEMDGYIAYYYDLCYDSGYSEYIGLMLKGLGVAIVSNIGADFCRDCGEGQLASKLEFAGKIEILVISQPIVKQLIELSEKILVK